MDGDKRDTRCGWMWVDVGVLPRPPAFSAALTDRRDRRSGVRVTLRMDEKRDQICQGKVTRKKIFFFP